MYLRLLNTLMFGKSALNLLPNMLVYEKATSTTTTVIEIVRSTVYKQICLSKLISKYFLKHGFELSIFYISSVVPTVVTRTRTALTSSFIAYF